jgi:ADP-ribose pyrophosphatase YjhB (NUDIX family)
MKEIKDTPQWLKWAREIQSLGQIGLAFSDNHYEKARNKRIVEIASEIVEKYTNLEKEPVSKVFMTQHGYATPKIDVRSAVIKDGRILLVKEADDNRWAMPGGWADVGDYPSEVATRETKEESGFEVTPKKVIGVFDANRNGRALEFFHAFKIIFLCELTGGEAKESDETLAVDFFDLDHLPELSPNRTNMRHIEEIKKHLADKDRPALFD